MGFSNLIDFQVIKKRQYVAVVRSLVVNVSVDTHIGFINVSTLAAREMNAVLILYSEIQSQSEMVEHPERA